MKAKSVMEASISELYNAPINFALLEKYAHAIKILCNGEYGNVYFNNTDTHIFVCLGDSNPFDESNLEMHIKETVAKSYKDYDNIKVTIENECTPEGEDWIEM